MASSQVEVASSAPFVCVLRDQTRRNACRDSNAKAAQTTHQRNHKNLVRDHFNDGITVSSDYARDGNDRELDHEDREHNQCQPADPSSVHQAEGQQRHQGATSLPSYDSSVSVCFSDISELGASSLLKMWEKRLTRSNSNKTNSVSPTSTSSSGACNQEEENRSSETEECGDEHQGDGDSNRHSPHSIQSEAEKLERVRVADIIRRLSAASEETSNDVEQSCTCVLDQQAEQRMFTPSLRLRGRQAFLDLIMQMERDRNGELKALTERAAVSKFTHRGRIQAMLRLKLLQRGVPFYDPPYQHPPRASWVKKHPHGQGCSTITHLRERFNTASDHGNKVQVTEAANANKRSSAGEAGNNPTQSSSPGDDNGQREDNIGKSVSDNERGDNAPYTNHGPNTSNSTKHKAHMAAESVSHIRILDHHENVENNIPASVSSTTSVDTCNATWTTKVKASLGTSIDAKSIDKATPNGTVPKNFEQQQVADEATPYTDGCHGNGDTCTEQEVDARTRHQYAESNYDEMIEEIEESYGFQGETNNYDWIRDISRPRSFWENRRQEWYREMLSACSDNDQDIRQLIERKTVSNFLSSGLRERMDKLMVCHLGKQSILMMGNYENGESNAEMDQFMEFLHENSPSAVHHEQEGRAEDKEQEERQEEEHKHSRKLSLSSGQGEHHEVGDDFDQSVSSTQMPSPSLVRSWSYRDNDTGDDSDRPSPQHCQTFDNSPYTSPSNNHNSVEMELIYDMRLQMEQLHHEMAELRKSLKSCMDMQTSFKDSMTQRVQSAEGEAKKGSCRVCHEMKVDTVLYRCGHMCVCLKCANEMQWSSGKCPVCRAPIVDVVRVHVDV